MLETIIKLLSEQLGVNAADINESTLIFDDLGADSLDLAEFVTNLETELGITISEDEGADIRSVGDVVKLCESKK